MALFSFSLPSLWCKPPSSCAWADALIPFYFLLHEGLIMSHVLEMLYLSVTPTLLFMAYQALC